MPDLTLKGNVLFGYGAETRVVIKVAMMSEVLGRIVEVTSNGNARQETDNLVGKLINTGNGVIFLPHGIQNAEFTSANKAP